MDREDVQVTGEKGFEPREIATGLELSEFLKRTESSILVTNNEGDILLGYFEGHDCLLGEFEGKMYCGDLACEQEKIVWEEEEYSIDDVIDAVCEWNYELILEADAARNNPEDMIAFSDFQSKYDTLKADEVILDKLFDQTRYGKEIDQLAVRMANAFIENMDKDVGMAVAEVAEQVVIYSHSGRGR